MIFNSADRIRSLTPQFEGERLPDGRPFVPDDILERMKLVTNDEAWGVIERGHDYHFNFEGDWINMHPDRILIGRAVNHRLRGDGFFRAVYVGLVVVGGVLVAQALGA